ncbi:MAG: hypothetical protein Q9183_005851 [Haloplaca sp. 2 TL-2023]
MAHAVPVEELGAISVNQFHNTCLPDYVVYTSQAGIPNSACCSGHSAGNYCVPAKHLEKKFHGANPSLEPVAVSQISDGQVQVPGPGATPQPPVSAGSGNPHPGQGDPDSAPNCDPDPAVLCPVTGDPLLPSDPGVLEPVTEEAPPGNLLPPQKLKERAEVVPTPTQTPHHVGPGWDHSVAIQPLVTRFPTAGPHVSPRPHRPISANSGQHVGPGWAHSIHIEPLPTTLATTTKRGEPDGSGVSGMCGRVHCAEKEKRQDVSLHLQVISPDQRF